MRAMRALARSGGTRKGDALASTVGTTPAFLAQALTPLVRSGWIRSDPGPKGGYRLLPESSRLSVLDLVEAIEGPTADGRCVLSAGSCTQVTRAWPCAMHDAWAKARRSLLAELAAVTVLERARGARARTRRARRTRAA